jgi:reversibly glycosylated polypeptide/UDP-arabinopyranose mutase
MRVRGLPYESIGVREDVMMSMGLWSKNPDFDARTELERDEETEGKSCPYIPPPGGRLLARGEYAPICGMNLCVKREAIPLLYFAPSGDGVPYHRFDDIWMGIIAKKICDRLGWQISIGEPFIRHDRASDARKNLALEAPGMKFNETFWEKVDGINLFCDTAQGMLFEIGTKLHWTQDPYLKHYGECLRAWSALFRGVGK